MNKIIFILYLFVLIISKSFSNNLLDNGNSIIEDDYFECVQTSKEYVLKPNNKKKYAFIASNSTDINEINIDGNEIPQRMINFTEMYSLNINPKVDEPICFYILYSEKDIIQIQLKKKYNFYVLGTKYNRIMIEFELNDLLINKTVHLELLSKNQNTVFEDIYIYWIKDGYEIYHGNYLYKKDITITPLTKTIKIKLNTVLKDINNYDEFTVYAYITGRERYKKLVTTGIVFFYFSLFCLFFVLVSCCDKGYKKKWENSLDGLGDKFKEAYLWPCS